MKWLTGGLTIIHSPPIDTTVDSGFGSHEADTPTVANDWAAQLHETNWFCLMLSHQADKKDHDSEELPTQYSTHIL